MEQQKKSQLNGSTAASRGKVLLVNAIFEEGKNNFYKKTRKTLGCFGNSNWFIKFGCEEFENLFIMTWYDKEGSATETDIPRKVRPFSGLCVKQSNCSKDLIQALSGSIISVHCI